jgi:hypothetical protein
MQIHDFGEYYQAKSDGELIQLAAAPEQLTTEAHLALRGELSRRQISIAEDSVSQGNGASCNAGHVMVSGGLQVREPQRVADFVAEVLRTYHADFWLYFKITASAVVISTIALITSRNEVREISRHLPRGIELLSHKTEILEIWLVTFSEWIVSWIAFSFMFGATCIAVEERAAGFATSAWRPFLNVRERLGTFLRLSLLLFVLVLVAVGACNLFWIPVFWVLRHWQVHTTRFLIAVASYGLAGFAFLVVSRFALAVPAVVLDDCKVVQAMLRSDEFTQGKWLTLATLLAKSLVGGYVAGMCPFWLASFVRVSVPLPSWFPWILTVASIIGVSVVEPTMFIGFALLYLKMSATPSTPHAENAGRVANSISAATR